MSLDTRKTLCYLNTVAETYGYEITNPVDRFVLFFGVVCAQARSRHARVLADSGIYSLISRLTSGSFDFCGQSNPKQRALRSKECSWITGHITLLQKYHDLGEDSVGISPSHPHDVFADSENQEYTS